MRFPQWKLGEMLIVVLFVGIFLATAVRTWGDFFFIHGIFIAAVLLFPTCLLVLLMIRRHRADGHDP
jgi:hypothetical protein